LVKERYARRFRIDMTVPEHLRQKEKVKVVEVKEDKRFGKRKVHNPPRCWGIRVWLFWDSLLIVVA